MGYSKGRERLYNIIDATRIWDIVKGGKDIYNIIKGREGCNNENMGYSKGRERLYNIIDATRIWDIVKGGKDYIT